MGEQGGPPELLAALAENVVVVVAAGEPELVKRSTDPLTDQRRPSEVEWCAVADAIAPVGDRASSSIGV